MLVVRMDVLDARPNDVELEKITEPDCEDTIPVETPVPEKVDKSRVLWVVINVIDSVVGMVVVGIDDWLGAPDDCEDRDGMLVWAELPMLDSTDGVEDTLVMEEAEAETDGVIDPVTRQEQADDIREGEPWH